MSDNEVTPKPLTLDDRIAHACSSLWLHLRNAPLGYQLNAEQGIDDVREHLAGVIEPELRSVDAAKAEVKDTRKTVLHLVRHARQCKAAFNLILADLRCPEWVREIAEPLSEVTLTSLGVQHKQGMMKRPSEQQKGGGTS